MIWLSACFAFRASVFVGAAQEILDAVHGQSLVAPFVFPQLYKCIDSNPKLFNDSKSQAQEDLWLMDQIFGHEILGGYFIEIGAFDGVTLSNTWLFEKKFDWRGLLIEGHPANQQLLRINAPKYRKNAAAFSCAICPLAGDYLATAEFSMKGGPIGTDISQASADFLDFWHGNNTETTAVACVPLQHLIDASGVRDFDLFSLDVEGGELVVLETIDFHITNIHVILVELDGGNPKKDNAVRKLLTIHGFISAKDKYGDIRDYCPDKNFGCTSNEVFINPHFHHRKMQRRRPLLFEDGTASFCGESHFPKLVTDKDRVIKYGNTIYTIYENKRHRVTDMMLFHAYSFEDGDIQTVSQEEFDVYPEGLPLLRYKKHDATMNVGGDTTIYGVSEGRRYKIEDFDQFISEGNADWYNRMTMEQLQAIPEAPQAPQAPQAPKKLASPKAKPVVAS